ncbi:DsbA family protein [Vibrio cholerae]|uniref:DsbA family protein n=1 Tax=Vibrio cholerae TaxID=666 RepID=UPI003C6FE231
MTEQSTKSLRLGVVAAILLGLVGTGFGIYQFVKEKDLAQEIANVKSTVNQVKDAEGVTFKSKAEFEAAVAESINKFVAQKQQADIDQKYAQFEAAPGEGRRRQTHLRGPWCSVHAGGVLRYGVRPFCKRFHDTPKQIVDASKGNVNWQWKHMPLDFHNPAAHKEALAAECIAEQKGNRGFWVFVNDIFHHTQGNGGGVADLASVVTGVGADLDAFRECLGSGKYEDKVEADIQKAKSYGVNGTPATFVVDNHT